MHIHKMFKRMHKKHGGPPPPMCHGPPMYPGMWQNMIPKPHEMWHHKMPKPHEMWPHMAHKMHPMFHKMHHKIHKKHHKKHRGRSSSSSSSSSSSESEDECLADEIDKVQIGEEQQSKENPGTETAAPPCESGDVRKEKFKHKNDKHLKQKERKGRCKYCYKMMKRDPYWMQCSLVEPCRDSRYNKGAFHLPPPEINPDPEEGRTETEPSPPQESIPQVRFAEGTGPEKSRFTGKRSLKRGQRRGDSIDYFMLSIAEQIKKLPEPKIAEAKLKILEVVNGMQMGTAPELDTSGEFMVVENQQPEEPQLETISAS